MPISNVNPSSPAFKAREAKKKVEEASGKKGRELAKKVAKVGKPKVTAEAGTRLVRKYGGGKEWETVYEKLYSPKQEAKIKMTQRQMKLERERTSTRANAKAGIPAGSKATSKAGKTTFGNKGKTTLGTSFKQKKK